jgi:hypothetical protein
MICPLCKRSGGRLVFERHHLRTKRTDKDLTERVCRECHKTIHGLFTHQQLRDPEAGLDTIEGLLADKQLTKALGYIRKVPPGAHMRMKQARGRRWR